jgi:hypothetical protein
MLAKTIQDHLDSYRLLTTTLRIGEPVYLGVKVYAEVVPSEYSQPQVVRSRILERLRSFISPLSVGGEPDEYDGLMDRGWEGWPFGRSLYVAEIFTLIQRVPGVKHVLDVQLATRPVDPGTEVPDGTEEKSTPQETLSLKEKTVIQVPPDGLLCSLEHEVAIVELGEHDEQNG